MTKDELLEDVNTGNIVKIHMEAGKVFECLIIVFLNS